jgi:hypothetical protein
MHQSPFPRPQVTFGGKSIELRRSQEVSFLISKTGISQNEIRKIKNALVLDVPVLSLHIIFTAGVFN